MEFWFALFTLSGIIKGVLIYFDITLPVDLTLLTFAILALVTFWRFTRNGFKVSAEGLTPAILSTFLLFSGWLVLSLAYTASEQFSHEKVLKFIPNLFLVFPFLVKRFSVRKVLKYETLFGLASAFLWVLPILFLYRLQVYPRGYETSRTAVAGYLQVALLLGILSIIGLSSRRPVWSEKMDKVVALLSALGMILLGARGPILAFLGILVIMIFLRKGFSLRFLLRKRVAVFAAVALILLVSTLVYFQSEANVLFSRTFGRFQELIASFSGGEVEASTEVRFQLLSDFFGHIFTDVQSAVLGYGIGSFGIITRGEDVNLFPHNIILEIWFELGLVGLLIFASFILLIVLKKVRYVYLSKLVLLFIFLNLLKSYSLVDIRVPLSFLALYLASSNSQQEPETT